MGPWPVELTDNTGQGPMLLPKSPSRLVVCSQHPPDGLRRFAIPTSHPQTLPAMPRLSLAALLIPVFLSSSSLAQDPARDAAIVETLLRLPGYNLDANAKAKAAVLRHLETQKGKPRYFELVEKLKLHAAADSLLEMALTKPDSQDGVKAASLLFAFDKAEPLLKTADAKDEKQALAALKVLGLTGDPKAIPHLLPLVSDRRKSLTVQIAAVAALGKSVLGQREILKLAEAKKLAKGLHFTASSALNVSPDPQIRQRAAELIALPQTADQKPLPSLAELVKTPGDAVRGKAVFLGEKGICHKCHKVHGQGKEVGPDLSEIGSKLPKEALYVSILTPSAGVSHNYETYSVILLSGNVESGILTSRTDESVTIRTADAISKTFPMDDVDEIIKQKVSLMPADLQKNMTVRELADVVEYLTTLKKAAK